MPCALILPSITFATALCVASQSEIEDNLDKDLTLSKISKALGYSSAHVSRTFKKYVNSSIPNFVNKLRLERVDKLLKKKNVKKTEAIYSAGFNSYQTYYRIKSKNKL